LTLDVIADQRASAQANGAADGCSGSRMAFGAADSTADCRATKSADTCAFFSCCQWSAGTPHSGDGSDQAKGAHPGEKNPSSVVNHFSSFHIFERSIWMAIRATRVPSIDEANSLIFPRFTPTRTQNASVKITAGK
jgi:hypothetical protein